MMALALAGCSSTSDTSEPPAGRGAVDAGAAQDAAGNSGSSSGGGGGSSGGVDATVPNPPDEAGASDATTGDDGSGPTGAALIARLLELTKTCTGGAVVSAHTYTSNNGKPVDICKLNGAVYYTAKMAIDCDGKTTTHCPGTGADKDCCYYDDTSFHNLQDEPLSAEFDPYVVIPQDFHTTGLDQSRGGNVIAVIYKGVLHYAVFGDQGPSDSIGEASYRTAANFGINPSPAVGGVDGDVTYIVFVGAGTQPHDIESTTEIDALGASLAATLVQQNP